jgi:ribosomal protein S12 methylthiotransferase accessory factor
MGNEMKVTFPGGMRVDAEYKDFSIKTDQPVYQGGQGSEPAPFDLFLASLVTCAGFYVLSFLNSRELAADETTLILRAQKNSETKMITKITIEILLPPTFPEKYKKAVIKAVDVCAVKQHMLKPPAFEVVTSTIKG